MSEGIISVVFFFNARKVKSNTTTLTQSSHHAQYIFFWYFYFSSFTAENARNVFPHNRAAIDWKEWETKIVFLWFSNNHSCLCWCFSFFFSTQHSVVAHVIFLFTCCLILLLSTFFFFPSTFNYFSLTLASFFSNSLARSHSLTDYCRRKYSSSLLQTIFYYDMIMWNCIIIIATDVFNNWLRLWNWIIFTLTAALRVRERGREKDSMNYI